LKDELLGVATGCEKRDEFFGLIDLNCRLRHLGPISLLQLNYRSGIAQCHKADHDSPIDAALVKSDLPSLPKQSHDIGAGDLTDYSSRQVIFEPFQVGLVGVEGSRALRSLDL
jgi:hypothetical protein